VSQLIVGGLDVATVSRRIGHSNPTVTLGVYSHLFGAADERALHVLKSAWAGMLDRERNAMLPVAMRWQ
jgi:hypothetical protein